mgnify:CR=1 FL=1
MQENQAAIAGSTNTRLMGQGSSGLLVLTASALFWSWFDSGVFRPTFLAPFASSTWMFLPYLITALAAGGIVLLVACLRSKHQICSDSPQPAPDFNRQRWIYAAVTAFVGTVASLSGAAFGLLPLVLLGAAGTGASCGFFNLHGAQYTLAQAQALRGAPSPCPLRWAFLSTPSSWAWGPGLRLPLRRRFPLYHVAWSCF